MSTSAQAIPGLIELGRKNQPNGYVGIDGSGDVIGTFAQRRDTAANIAGIVLANGELAFTTDTKETFIGDGVTQGGLWWYSVAQYQESSATLTTTSLGADDTEALSFSVGPGLYDVSGYLYCNPEFGGRIEFYLRGPYSGTEKSTTLQLAWANSQGGECRVKTSFVLDPPLVSPTYFRPLVADQDGEIECYIAGQVRCVTSGTLKFAVVHQTTPSGSGAAREFNLSIKKVADL